MLRGVPWDKLFHNFKNIARDILSSKIFVKYLNTCQVVLCIYNDGTPYWKYLGIYLYIFPSKLFVVHYSAKYNSEDNLLEDKKIFSSKVNKTEKPFKDSLGYPSNPLNPSNPPNPSNPLSPSHPPNPCPHLPNPRFKDSPGKHLRQSIFFNKVAGLGDCF